MIGRADIIVTDSVHVLCDQLFRWKTNNKPVKIWLTETSENN